MSLAAHAITAGYAGPPVLRDVDLEIRPGRIVGLTGPSGSGKSTLARALAGLLHVSAGTVTVDGSPIVTRRGRMTGQVALLFQSPRRACDPRHRLERIIAQSAAPGVDLHACAVEVGLTDELLHRLPAQVSEGQLQRAALARAFARSPSYLIADEATAMLDAATTASIAVAIRRRAQAGLGVLAISHDHALLHAWADEVLDVRDVMGLASRAADGA